MTHKDFFENEIAIGDSVAFIESHYRNLVMGTVVDMTPQKVRIEFTPKANLNPITTLIYPINIIVFNK